MYPKILSLTLASMVATSAFAQVDSNLSTSVEREVKKTYQKGFSVGAEYMNVTDINFQIKFKRFTEERTREGTLTDHLGIAGVRIGYTQVPEKGLGGNAAVSFLQAFNKSEFTEEREQFLIPQFNIHYAFNPRFTVFWGGNVSLITKGENKNVLKPDLGGQLGLGIRFTRNIALNAGYTLMRFRIDEELDNSVQATGSMLLSGFNSNLTYTF